MPRLIELLVVMAILGILAALLLPRLAGSKERAARAQCLSNARQIGLGLKLYADEGGGFYPVSGAELPWDLMDNQTQSLGWMQQIFTYVKNLKVYQCPNDRQSPYSYFNGARAAFLLASNHPAPVNSRLIQYPSAYVLSGDTLRSGTSTNDADKDDYVQNCVGGAVNGEPIKEWQIHNQGQNLLFEDGHAQWYRGYVSNEMTFRYEALHGWK